MQIVTESTVDGVTEREFALEMAGERVPGIVWTPRNAATPRPLVLMGHGGSQHKRVSAIVSRARAYVVELGFAVVAIDAPGHGDRVSAEDSARFAAEIAARIRAGEKVGGELADDLARRAAQGVPEWRATLDALQLLPEIGDSEGVGYWGLSMGAAIGIPLVASDSRITAAVLGLAGVIGSAEKSLHVNRGGHLGVPSFERDNWQRFFARHLAR